MPVFGRPDDIVNRHGRSLHAGHVADVDGYSRWGIFHRNLRQLGGIMNLATHQSQHKLMITKEFNTLTRSLTPPVMPTSLEEFASLAISLCE